MLKKILMILGIVMLTMTGSQSVEAKSYSIPKTEIRIVIDDKGITKIRETRTYSFSGFYQNGEWLIGLKRYCPSENCGVLDIDNVKLYEGDKPYRLDSTLSEGVYWFVNTGEQVKITWKYRAVDESKKFTLEYELKNAIVNWTDVSEFYWTLVGEGWNKSTELSAVIELPKKVDNTQIRAWAHGPIEGMVSIDKNNRVLLTNNLPSNTFADVRIVFPVLSGIKTINKAGLSKIIAEEEKNIADTRAKYEEQNKPVEYKWWLIGGSWIFLLWRGIYWFKFWRKYGKDYKSPEVNLAGSLHEPPSDLHPVLVSALISNGRKPTTQAITGALLDFARRKIISFSEETKPKLLGLFGGEKELIITVLKEIDSLELSDYERDIFKSLGIKEKKSYKQSEIKEYTSSHVSAYQAWERISDDCASHLDELGYIDDEGRKKVPWLWAEIALLFVFWMPLWVTITAFVGMSEKQGMSHLGFITLPLPLLIIFLIVLAATMDRLSEVGTKAKAEWLAFRKYLVDYSVTKQSPIDSVIIWEKYIVYGATLGVSLKALSQLPISFKAPETSSIYTGLYVNHVMSDSVFNFSNNITYSYSSGRNGGYSSSWSFGASGGGSSGHFSGGGGGGSGGGGGGMS